MTRILRVGQDQLTWGVTPEGTRKHALPLGPMREVASMSLCGLGIWERWAWRTDTYQLQNIPECVRCLRRIRVEQP